ncbi:sulfated surface glycoprotein 185-like [Haliotis rufescens]|uniref:sulfated surface glycoprotein 185-like n=1 Tax=Haliotis rufescens TaxID=6454 RepID=UPI00201F7648|nr:sulfated surface glycoprotein 185-like [Haliotis rufescens]
MLSAAFNNTIKPPPHATTPTHPQRSTTPSSHLPTPPPPPTPSVQQHQQATSPRHHPHPPPAFNNTNKPPPHATTPTHPQRSTTPSSHLPTPPPPPTPSVQQHHQATSPRHHPHPPSACLRTKVTEFKYRARDVIIASSDVTGFKSARETAIFQIFLSRVNQSANRWASETMNNRVSGTIASSQRCLRTEVTEFKYRECDVIIASSDVTGFKVGCRSPTSVEKTLV